MRVLRYLVFAVMAVFLVVGTFGCTKKEAPAPKAKASIKVGIVLPLTGKHAKFGEIEKQSFVMAADEINAAGGINGAKLELLIEDTQGKPDIGRSAMEKLITRTRS